MLLGLVAPALFWLGYFYYKDRVKPEPLGLLALTYGIGVACGFLGLKAYDLAEFLGMPDAYLLSVTHRPWFFVYVVGFVGLVEELVKFAAFGLVVLRYRAFDEEIDGIVYASALAIGYASYENVLYLPEMEGWALYGRAFASPLVHTVFSSIWGFAVARARIRGEPVWRPTLVGLGLAALVHGVYDFIATDPLLQPAATLAIAGVWFWRLWVLDRLHKEQLAQPPEAER